MMKRILTQTNINSHVSKICREITNSNWKPDYVVGITRGGLVPAVMISHYFDVPLQTLKVSLRGELDTETNAWMADDAFGYDYNITPEQYPKMRKNILLVDDINDTGATFKWIMKDWQRSCAPRDKTWDTVWHNNVRFAVLVENLSSGTASDYHAIEINKSEDDVWYIFPWEEWWTK